MRPRARVLVVDGTSFPVPRGDVLAGDPHPVPGAPSARLVQGETLELLIEDAGVDDASLIARGRGVDAIVVLAGPMLERRVDALAIASVLRDGARPVLFVVTPPDREAELREVLLAARLDADDAVMLAATDDLRAALDEHLPRAPSTRLRAIAEGFGAVLVSGEAPASARAWGLFDDGCWPVDVVLPAAARAGDVVPLVPPSRAIDGSVDEEVGPPPCLFGRVALFGEGPPRGADVIAFTDGGESEGTVDESGALVLRRALPLRPGAALGVLVVRTALRASPKGALSARVLECFPDPADPRGALRRRPSRTSDGEALYALHEASMRTLVEQTYGAWDDAFQRAELLEKQPVEGRFQLVVALDESEQEKELVASYRLQRRVHEIVLASVEVAPAHQNRGHGTAIVEGLLAEATRSFARLSLTVLKLNPRARALYERLGLDVVGETETHWRMTAAMGPRPTAGRQS